MDPAAVLLDRPRRAGDASGLLQFVEKPGCVRLWHCKQCRDERSICHRLHRQPVEDGQNSIVGGGEGRHDEWPTACGGPRQRPRAAQARKAAHGPASSWSPTSLCSMGAVGLGRRRIGTPERISACPLRRPSLPSELLLNRRRHEVHEDDVVRHAIQPEATVKLLRDADRQLRPGFFGIRHLCRLVLRSPRPARTTPTPATAAPVLRARHGRDSAEQRLHRSAHFLLRQVADDRHQALLSRHRVLLSGGKYTERPITSKGSEAGEPASGEACWQSASVRRRRGYWEEPNLDQLEARGREAAARARGLCPRRGQRCF